jgi:hypothetical protein
MEWEKIMPALSFHSILQQEKSLLDEAAKKLAVFDREVESAGDQIGEVVYSSLVSALNAARKAYDEITQVVAGVEAATAQGRVATEALPPTMAGHVAAFQGSGVQVPAMNNIIMALRLCAQRPSDVWRGEIRKQAGALLERLHGSLSQGTDAKAVAHAAQIYTSAFCWFELAWFDNDGVGANQPKEVSLFSQLLSWKGALLVAGVATAGYFGGGYVVPYVSEKVGGLFGSRTKNKELADGEDDDEDDDDVEEVDEEVIFDVEMPEPLALAE